MKTISIKQPWAYAILYMGKNVENRTWKTKYRGTILIHAGKVFDRESYDWMLENSNGLIPHIESFQRGGIVGQVDIIDCVQEMNSPWFAGPNGWILKNAKPLPFFPCKGRLSFFNVNYPPKPIDGGRRCRPEKPAEIAPTL